MPASLTLTDDVETELVKAVENGVPIETACQAAGIGQHTFYDWLNAHETGLWHAGQPIEPETLARLSRFSQSIRSAQARYEATRLANIKAATEAINAKTGLRDWRADAWLLNNHPRYRKTYRPDKDHAVTTTGHVTHELVAQAPTEQLLAWSEAAPLPEGDQG